MIALSIVIGIIGLVFALQSLSDLISLVAIAVHRSHADRTSAGGPKPRFLVLVPAHDEALLIAETVRSVRRLRWPADRCRAVVVADNCTDDTALIARAEGAEAWERTDSTLRGKPYAIAWALERIELAGVDAVVVLDADSTIDPGYCDAVFGAGPVRDRAFQGWIDVSNRGENALTRMGAVFSAARCLYANRIKTEAGLTVPFGNGLCLGAGILERHGWNAFSICEDWELYALLTRDGVPILGVPGAHTYSQEARSLAQGASQRSRWTAGKLTVLIRYARGLLSTKRIGWRQKLDAMAELTAPGPVVQSAVAVLLAAVAWFLAVPGWPLLVLLLLASLVRQALFALLALRRDPEPGRALLAFVYLPFYAIWRLGIQIKSLTMVGDKPWVKTARHVDPEGGKQSGGGLR